MKRAMRGILPVLSFSFLAVLFLASEAANGQVTGDTAVMRVSIHVFNNQQENGNFHPDSSRHKTFLWDVVDWINFRMINMDTLKPEVPSPYIKSLDTQIRIDSIFYHIDDYAWDCSDGIDSHYMRQVYVDRDSSLNYRQKFRTLHVFIGGNYSILGGHNSLIGDKWFIAMRGMFTEFLNRPYNDAVRDCGRGLLHELGHSLGLSHNFKGGPHGDQCDQCEDNGCPEEGTSNNIMDYWPSYGYAVSACQKEIAWEYLRGSRGNISEVLWNDSCYKVKDQIFYISEGESLSISDTSYLHSDLVVKKGGSLIVNSYLSVPDRCKIVIEPGAALLVQNGTLGNLCGDLWEGVLVMKSDSLTGGSVSFKNGNVENARSGIIIEGHQNIEIAGTQFIDNLSSLRILSWPGRGDISDCRFGIKGRLHHWEEWQVPESFVWLESVDSIVFSNCEFYNSEGHRNYEDLYSGIGIISSNSSLSLKSCSFENLFKGVVAGDDSTGKSLTLDSCFFAYNHCSVQLAGQTITRITSSAFNLNRLNTMPVYGICAAYSRYVDISDCDFYSDYGGENLTAIVSDFQQAGTHLIHNNKFSLLNEGILVVNSGNCPEWPGALNEYIYPDISEEPVGSVWFLNQFDKVSKQLVSVDSVGNGVLKSAEGEYGFLSVDLSRSLSFAGFGPYVRDGDLCIINPNEIEHSRTDPWMQFYILTGNSWYEYDTTGFENVSSGDIFDRLAREYNEGISFLNRELPGSHESWVALAAVMEKYPWLVYTLQFGQLVGREENVIPSWIWSEIFKALDRKTWWKNQFHYFLINLGKDQLKNNVKRNPISMDNGFELLPARAFKQINYAISKDIGRLKPGVYGFSSTPLFTVVPNPSQGDIGIRFKNEYPLKKTEMGLEWAVRDLFGRIVSMGFITEAEDLIIDPGFIPSGSYLIEIWNGNEFLGIQKFIILAD